MQGDGLEFTEQLIRFMKKTDTNEAFLEAFQDVTFNEKNAKNRKR